MNRPELLEGIGNGDGTSDDDEKFLGITEQYFSNDYINVNSESEIKCSPIELAHIWPKEIRRKRRTYLHYLTMSADTTQIYIKCNDCGKILSVWLYAKVHGCCPARRIYDPDFVRCPWCKEVKWKIDQGRDARHIRDCKKIFIEKYQVAVSDSVRDITQ